MATTRPYVSMTSRGDVGPRLRLGAGQHVMLVGATGARKTTTARRLIGHSHPRSAGGGARARSERRRRGRRAAEAPRRRRERAVRPLCSQNQQTDRWQPLRRTPDGVAARAVEPIAGQSPTTTTPCAPTSTLSARCRLGPRRTGLAVRGGPAVGKPHASQNAPETAPRFHRAAVQGRRRAPQLITTNFEHIPPNLLAHHLLAPASRRRSAV